MAEGAGSFITRSFERMLKDSTEKKFPDLHKALKAYLERSKSVENLSPTSPKSSSGSVGQGDATSTGTYALDGELVLIPLRLAFETRQPKLVESALDCLHKLISYGNLEGDAGLEGGENSALVTEVFNMVCDVAHTSVLDSTILQVMKVLLIGVASTKFRVHGDCLTRSIHECIHIVISSKSLTNQATAKATLIQMVSIIFKRMEGDSKGQYNCDEGMDTVTEAFVSSERFKDVDRNALSIGAVSMEELQRLVVDVDMKGLEAALGKGGSSDGGMRMPGGPNLEGMPLAQQDALIVFHMLCQTSVKEESKDVLKKEKVLCLEQLQGVMENASKSLIMNPGFMCMIKEYLCYVLLRAGMSSTPSIFELSCDIFGTLILRFREALKIEIGVLFFFNVLRPLDRLDTPVLQRLSVLRLLENICKDAQIVADIFVNYDCDPEAINLFERMVRAISKIVQGKGDGNLTSGDVPQMSQLKVYLGVLNQALLGPQPVFQEEITSNSCGSVSNGLVGSKPSYDKMATEFQEYAEGKLISFCERNLKEASDRLPGINEAINSDAYMALTLRVPVVVMVMDEMCKMPPHVFQRHLADFYPYFMRLICSEQLEVRRALDDLFKAQLVSALP